MRSTPAGVTWPARLRRRTSTLDELEISVTPCGRMTPQLAVEFARAGAHRLAAPAPPATGRPAQAIETAAAAIADL